MSTEKNYVIGIDYGTDSVRAVLVDASNGNELAAAVSHYPRWKAQKFCDASKSIFRQHPLDYVEGLTATIKEVLAKVGNGAASHVKGISVDTTGSTPIAVNKDGVPLALLDGFTDNPNAMFVLWKDHSAIEEAKEINNTANNFTTNYLQYVGGIYSSEWFWAKLLHILRVDAAVRANMYTWVEHCDWIPFLLTGGNDAGKIRRSVCAAGHKALFATAFDGYPPNDFFKAIDPLLDGWVETLGKQAYAANESAGLLSEKWAAELGLSTNVVVGIGAFDAHMGAVGGQIEPYYLSKVMGTSTCDMLVAPTEDVSHTLVKGICGQVNGSIIPGMIGLEAGQSAFGDVYAWWKNVLLWPTENLLEKMDFLDDELKKKTTDFLHENMIKQLTAAAEVIPPDENLELATDWLNGRRTPDANQEVKATLSGLSLASDAPRIFRALAEATCFGAKAIVERFIHQGIEVKGLIGMGGVAKKSAFIMQMMSDIMNMPIKIHKSDQTCAVGAAMFAATVAGIYPTVDEAMKKMGSGFETTYSPDPSKAVVYEKRYEAYKKLGMAESSK